MPTKLHRHVVVGLPDVCMAGCSALLCAGQGTATSVELKCISASEDDAVIGFPQLEEHSDTLSRIFVKEIEELNISLIAITWCGSVGAFGHALVELMDLCRSSDVEEITIVSAALLRQFDDVVFEATLNGAHRSSLPCLPNEATISDPRLNALIQLLKVEKMKARFLLTPGYKLRQRQLNAADGSLASALRLASALEKMFGISFDEEKLSQLVISHPPTKPSSSSELMYL